MTNDDVVASAAVELLAEGQIYMAGGLLPIFETYFTKTFALSDFVVIPLEDDGIAYLDEEGRICGLDRIYSLTLTGNEI